MTIEIITCTPMPDQLHAALAESFACIDYDWQSGEMTAPETRLAAVRGVALTGEGQVPETLIDRLPALEIISVFGAGYDGVPVSHCRARGIKVAHTPGLMSDDAADLATALVLMTGRNLVQADAFLRRGDWMQRSFPLSATITGKRAGIFGLGRIGTAIAHRLVALGMQIAYADRAPRSDLPWRHYADLEELAAASDFLVLCCPGGPETHNIVGPRVLRALGPEGILINTSRGSVVDEAALIAALRAGTIRAAGLDVFADEPEVPPELVALDNTVLTPHIGSATRETRMAMAALCRSNLLNWFSGGGPVQLAPGGS